jgi:hypothetical protein
VDRDAGGLDALDELVEALVRDDGTAYTKAEVVKLLLDADLAAALAAIEDDLHWARSASYSDAILGEGFCDNYGWAELIGCGGFFDGDDFRADFGNLHARRG